MIAPYCFIFKPFVLRHQSLYIFIITDSGQRMVAHYIYFMVLWKEFEHQTYRSIKRRPFQQSSHPFVIVLQQSELNIIDPQKEYRSIAEQRILIFNNKSESIIITRYDSIIMGRLLKFEHQTFFKRFFIIAQREAFAIHKLHIDNNIWRVQCRLYSFKLVDSCRERHSIRIDIKHITISLSGETRNANHYQKQQH